MYVENMNQGSVFAVHEFAAVAWYIAAHACAGVLPMNVAITPLMYMGPPI